ncbi:protein IQ-DOMAIN 1-like [Panicum miliaceum]|uniref:Protein IQ-DOMAIN 1-like n=1 Tax=Panicum miliaceum TaxID=4540 RepID=A0A3L6S2B1_PANMI|nr:protein IQ-DOMAIN 1-like [Panicum miliaceum]
MGSGDWFKTIISKKKSKRAKSKHAKLAGQVQNGGNQTNQKSNGPSSSSDHEDNAALEEWAATRIQNAFRKYKARKTLRCLRGVKRLRIVGQANPVKKQTAATLSYIQSWNKLQSEIRNRRAFMVTEGRNRKKKQENQMKLESKLHNLQVEWNGGSDTMDEILARIQQREEAAVKRERAMAYAFNHQWRARSATSLGNFSYEVGKGGWGWSWMDRWIAARPWEPRSLVHPENPKKAQAKKENSNTNPSALKLQGSISLSNNINDRKVPKKKPTPSPTDQKKSSPSPTDQKKPAPSPSSDQKKAAPKEQKAKAAGTPPKPKAKEMKGRQEKQQQVVPSVSA